MLNGPTSSLNVLFLFLLDKCYSYNVHCYNVTKKDYISYLLEPSSFLFLQEHSLNNAQLNTFLNAFSGYCIHAVSAIDSSVFIRGRPHGVVLIMFPDTYDSKVTIIKLYQNVCVRNN